MLFNYIILGFLTRGEWELFHSLHVWIKRALKLKNTVYPFRRTGLHEPVSVKYGGKGVGTALVLETSFKTS